MKMSTTHSLFAKSSNMVEVAVIGAGAAGLTAARHLLKVGLRPFLFDAALQIGGAWNRSGQSSSMWDSLRPNLSKNTCRFSDFDWPSTTTNNFPTDVGEYLNAYAEEYILHDEKLSLKLGCQVQKIFGDTSPYTVEWTDVREGSINSQVFTGVVIATGFFTTPKYPSCIGSLSGTSDTRTGRILHSSDYKNPNALRGKNVAVVGGSFSAHEIASDIGRHGKTHRLVSVVGNAFTYVLPRYVPNGMGHYAPLDTVLYRRRSAAPNVPMKLLLDQQDCRDRHTFLKGLVGATRIKQLVAKGFPSLPAPESVPLASISDDYVSMVIADKIEVQAGKVIEVKQNEDGRFHLRMDNGDSVEDMDVLIACTGYSNRLEFLSESVRDIIEYDSEDSFAPMILCYDTYHPKLPHMGFVGMTKGIYFGIMELQARLVAARLSGSLPVNNEEGPLEQSRMIRKHRPRAQFPRFDYIGFMDTLAEQLGLRLDPKGLGAPGTFVSPSCFSSQPEKPQIDEVDAPMAKIALNALVGSWKFDRTIEDHMTNTIQCVKGTIQYRYVDDGLRYREDGELELTNGNKLTVFREYDYKTTDDGKALEIYFVDQGERTYMFLSLLFENQGGRDGTWTATSDHLCIKDLYKGTFRISFDGIGATNISMTYRVNGPNKNYESRTTLFQI